MTDALDSSFRGAATVDEAQRHVVRVRFAEALQRQSAFAAGDEALHAFRLACKRLRYCLERLQPEHPELQRASELLSALTDELGWAHDCARLAAFAQEQDAPIVAARCKRDRDRYRLRARRLWRHAFRTNGEFAALAAYAGYTWSLP